MDNKTRQQTEPKQVIVIRKDLNMSSGKLAAQVSHASIAPITKKMIKTEEKSKTIYKLELNKKDDFDLAMELWLSNRFTKVVVYVKSEQALLNVYNKAKEKGLPCALIQDAGFTEFNGEPTYTCVGIGPCFPKYFEGITNKLRLFQGN